MLIVAGTMYMCVLFSVSSVLPDIHCRGVAKGGFLWYLGPTLGQIEGPLTEIVDASKNLQGHYIQVQPPCNKVKHCTLSNMGVFYAVKKRYHGWVPSNGPL